MSTPDPLQPQPDPASPMFFLRSPVFISIAVAFVSKLLTLFGRHVSDEIITADVQQVLDLVTLASLAVAGYKRWRSTLSPLSLTKSKGISNEPIAPVPGSSPSAAAVVGGDPLGFPPCGTPGITEEPQRSKPADPPTLPPAA